jgi:histidinol-phosphate/aromatic aminotransferase/cobyric acid decarboxylase-like protein
MAIPSGEIVARPLVARACGCLKEFQHYAVDKYRAQRLAKFQKTRCEDCVAKLNEEQKRAAADLPKKGEAFQLLPSGAQFSITRKPDGSWAGSLAAEGVAVQATGDGPQGIVVTLARQWVLTRKMKK